ncbi:MAG: hypothetical protein ABIV50_04470 [Opitutus sp.]
MMGDPQHRRAGLEQVATSANGNQRVTRALTVLAVQLTGGAKLDSPAVARAFHQVDEALMLLAQAARLSRFTSAPATPRLSDVRITVSSPPSGSDPAAREYGILVQLARIATELNAMRLAAAALATISPEPGVNAAATS